AGAAKDARDKVRGSSGGDVEGSNGRTALFWAQVQGHTAVVNALLEAGAQDTGLLAPTDAQDKVREGAVG
ncbi:hypothetical protein T484DRAFT_1821453, partial [Baffinella frigidus]